MRSVNKVTLMGHVGKDPEVKATQSGAIIANLSLATSYKTGGKDGGESKEVTEWHRLVAFNRTAEIIRDYVKKGAPLYIEGQIQTRSWDKDGEKRYTTEIVIRELWDSINAKRGYGWDVNPWVWVVSFQRVQS
ncbi:MAG: single-stranded DNA-binding protein [Terracidiphilus sp.]